MAKKVDKTGWGAGPWRSEPDELDFEHCGFACHIIRHETMGHLLGYVDVPYGHPWYGKNYDDIAVECHGGLTFAAAMAAKAWRVGFDCAHLGDLSPGMNRHMTSLVALSGTYKTMKWVEREVKRLAEQASQATGDH